MNYLERHKYNLMNTKIGDDIDMIVNLIDQLRDIVEDDDIDEPSTQIPDPTVHQKYWEEIGIKELVGILEEKYSNAERLEVPEEFTTSF